MTLREWLHSFFIHGLLPQEPCPDSAWNGALQSYAHYPQQPLVLPFEVWMNWALGDIALMKHTPFILHHPDSLFHMHERHVLPDKDLLIRQHYAQLPDYSDDTLLTWVSMLVPHASEYTLSTVYNCIAETLSHDDFDHFLGLLEARGLPIVPPYRIPSFFTTSLLWNDIWKRLSFERVIWNDTFLQYMEPYWEHLPYGLFLIRLSPEQQLRIPLPYRQAIDLFEDNASLFFSLETQYLEKPFQIPLGLIHQHYAINSEPLMEIPLY